MGINSRHIIDLSRLYGEGVDLVGKKAFELGELKYLDILIPDGFVITSSFFEKFLYQTGIAAKIKEIQQLSHPSIQDSIEILYDSIRKTIIHYPIPQNLSSELHKFYRELSDLFNESSFNIFTSSMDNKSLQYLNVKGDANLLLRIKEIWALQLHNPAAIIVQKNIKSKKRGKITTNNPPKELANIARKIRNHFYFPQEIDYAVIDNKIYITAISPFTGNAEELSKPIQDKKMQKVLFKGFSINSGIATGPVRIFRKNDLVKAKNGEIIVLPRLDMFSYSKTKRVKAVVIDAVLPSSYDRMVYREKFKIPTIEGTKNATEILRNGNIITVNGVDGKIYEGGLM